MKYVSFPEVGLKLSQLAFGCAPVMGKVGRRAALTAMEAAYDCGVTHFDVARSYGYGEAETVLGAFARGKRDRITIATKFGIAPRQSASVLRLVKPAVRALMKHVAFAKSLVTKASSHALAAGRYDLASARASFEESLRQLGTDYVDILFIHDCSPHDALTEDLLAYLDALTGAGKIRAWGIATHREWVGPVYEKLAGRPRIVQCEQNFFTAPPLAGRVQHAAAVFHSPFGGAGSAERLSKDALSAYHETRIGGRAIPVPPSDASRFLLEYALRRAGNNTVLCSMFDGAHIAANIDAVDRPRFTDEVERFLLASECRAPATL